MMAVLITAQDKPMTAWRDQYYNISINAIVAVLSALSKGTSIFMVVEGTLAPPLLACFVSGVRLTCHSNQPDKIAVV
jgi:hypothetical protein